MNFKLSLIVGVFLNVFLTLTTAAGNPKVDTCVISTRAQSKQCNARTCEFGGQVYFEGDYICDDYSCLQNDYTGGNTDGQMFYDGLEQKWICKSPSCNGDAKMTFIKETKPWGTEAGWKCISPTCQYMINVCVGEESHGCQKAIWACENKGTLPPTKPGQGTYLYKLREDCINSYYLLWDANLKSWECPKGEGGFNFYLYVGVPIVFLSLLIAVFLFYKKKQVLKLENTLSAPLNETVNL